MTVATTAPGEPLPRAIRELNTAMKVISFYPPQHPSVRVAVDRLLSTLHGVLANQAEVQLGFGEAGVLHGGEYLPDTDRGLHSFAAYLLNRGVARVTFRRGLDSDALVEFLRALGTDPARIAGDGGLSQYLSARRVTTIQIGEIDFERILASEAGPFPEPSAPGKAEPETWKRLLTDYLRGTAATPTEGMKTLVLSVAADVAKLSELTAHLSADAPQDLPRLLGRLGEEIRQEAPERMDRFIDGLVEALLKLDARTRMDLILSRIPLSPGATDLMDQAVRRMSEPVIGELVASFIETEQQLSPRLFAVCSKVFAARGKCSPYLGPITEHLRNTRKESPDLGQIWQSLQGLLVESDGDHLSETYRTTLEAISTRVESVDEELRSALQAAPGFGEAFAADSISDHACRVILAALDTEQDPARSDSLREDLDRRVSKMTGRQRLPVLGELVHVLSRPRDVRAKVPVAADDRTRRIVEQMVRIYRAEYERLTEEEKSAASRSFQESKAMAAPILLDGLAEEENWEVRKGLLTLLASLGRACVPMLLLRLKDPSWFLVRNAALLLGEIGGANLVEPLSSLLSHEEPRVRREAVSALAKIGGPRAIARLRKAVLDPEVSPVAARVLAEIDRDNTVALFSRRLQKAGPLLTDDGPVREAITVLGEMEAPEAVPALGRILNRGFWIPFSTGDALRTQAARALRRIGTLEAMQAIQKATRSTRRSVRDACESLVAEGLPPGRSQ